MRTGCSAVTLVINDPTVPVSRACASFHELSDRLRREADQFADHRHRELFRTTADLLLTLADAFSESVQPTDPKEIPDES